MPISVGMKKSFSRCAISSAYVCEDPAMIAAALLYVDRANGTYRAIALRFQIHHPAACCCLSSCGKPLVHGNPPLTGPITKGTGPFRRNHAKGLGNTRLYGAIRSTTSK